MVIGKSFKEPTKPTSQTPKCQRCLDTGHWTFQCKGKRKFLHRSSRSSLLNKRLKLLEDKEKDVPPSGSRKRIAKSAESTSSSSTNSSSSDTSSSDTVSTDSESDLSSGSSTDSSSDSE